MPIWLDILISFIFGPVSSFLIAKFVINKDVDKKMKTLKIQVKNNEVEKNRFLKNLVWVIENFGLSLPKASSDFKTTEEWESYRMGANDGIISRQKDIINRLEYGILETNSMFEDEWFKEDQTGKN